MNVAENGMQGKLSSLAYLEDWINSSLSTPIPAGESVFNLTFNLEQDFGVPGAFIIKNFHHTEFFLKNVTLEDVPGHGPIHFVCNSWVYPAEKC